jgi:hypothetical protein
VLYSTAFHINILENPLDVQKVIGEIRHWIDACIDMKMDI